MDARVLVVDDSITLRKVVKAILSHNGFECLAATDGQEALDLLDQAMVDLVLLDFVMPRMNGYQFCRELRSRPAIRDLPVVLMSAKAERIRDQFLRQTGAVDAITKPFDPRALVAVVEGALERTAQGRAPKAPSAADMPDDDMLSVAPESLPPSSMLLQGPHDVDVAGVLADALTSRLPDTDVDLDLVRRAVGEALMDESVAQAMQRVHWLTRKRDAEEVLYGDIESIPIGEIMQVLQMQRQTGILEISNRRISVVISLREGLVDLAQNQQGPPELRLGRYFLERELLTEERLDTAVRQAADQQSLLGAFMVREALVTAEDLEKALTRQTSEIIYEALRWPQGWFLLRRDVSTPEAEQARLGLPIASIVMEGFRRVDEWRVIEETIDFEETLVRDEAAISALKEEQLNAQEHAILSELDGQRSIRKIIEQSHQSSFDICKTFYRLLKSRLVRRKVA